MATFVFKCNKCNELQEVRAYSSLVEGPVAPECCGEPTVRSYRDEMFGGVTHRSKGVYPIVDNALDPMNRDVVVSDYQEHRRLMDRAGLEFHQRNPENSYRRKHARDRG